MKSIIIILIIITVLGFGYITLSNNKQNISLESGERKITVYKSPTCGCCANYISYLKKEGYDVEVKSSDLLLKEVKSENNIPSEVGSCHTSIIDGYFVEGHIPTEGIDKLLADRPDIAGIALAGMPTGAPGMPGSKNESFKIMSVSHDNKVSSFINL